jgi:catechol 2,3-dioxygenase-like lactoylglutathione lyase family enzyme
MPVQNFAHFGICVADPERSMRFYRDLLGFRPLTRLVVSDASSAQLVGLDDLDLHSYFLERDGVRIELLHYVSPGHEDGTVARPMNRRGLTHMALRVEGLAEMLEQIEQAGFQIMKSTHIHRLGLGTSVVFVLDPDGVRIELIELPGDPKQPLGEPLQA